MWFLKVPVRVNQRSTRGLFASTLTPPLMPRPVQIYRTPTQRRPASNKFRASACLQDGRCPCVASRREQVLWNSNSIDRQRATERTERHRSHLIQPPWNISASSIPPPLPLAFCLQIQITARWRSYQLHRSITNALFQFSPETAWLDTNLNARNILSSCTCVISASRSRG